MQGANHAVDKLSDLMAAHQLLDESSRLLAFHADNWAQAWHVVASLDSFIQSQSDIAPAPRSTPMGVGPADFQRLFQEYGDLRRILPVGGTARVSDERCRHGGKCTDRVPHPQLFPYHSYETLLAPVWRGSGRPTAPSAVRSAYGQRRACRDERITERWNMPNRRLSP